ncbi:hypothetical protein [Pseudactinotalea sp.]|uniref:hypothetical protein n=1 Tax=Pseudactinotalea sp. TaxID=1926260 RepID=UPI003B3B8BBA
MQPAAAPPELVVRSDNAALRSRFHLLLILNSVLVALSLVMIGVIGSLDLEGVRHFVWVFIVIAIGPILQIGLQCYLWGGRLAITRPLTLDGWGVEVHGQQGTVRVPWEAVTEVRQKAVLGQQLISFMLHPQATPGQNGVEADPAHWPRYRKRGLQLAAHGLVPGFETIFPAVQHYSQGRAPIV